ncbi:MAG: haloacid dehalogenase type II [Actinobacteria bacterium]|nr:haloacid dehalogenase type II [Actinomycetota bacterium]
MQTRPERRISVRRVCVFDVNETLLDLVGVEPVFVRLFEDPNRRHEWFAQVLQSALTSTIIGPYRDFARIAADSLRSMAERDDLALTTADLDQLSERMRNLPAHPDAAPALARLRSAGVRVAALTNSTASAAHAQLEHAQLLGFFEQVISADDAKRLKPALEAYELAAARLGVDLGDMRLIAAHGWDIAGARRAGCAAAFLARPGKLLDPLGDPPDITAEDLSTLVERVIVADA